MYLAFFFKINRMIKIMTETQEYWLVTQEYYN